MVSIVVLCTSDKVNVLYQKLLQSLRRTDFSYEFVFVYHQHEIYLENRPQSNSKFVCVSKYRPLFSQFSNILKSCSGEVVTVLSPEMDEAIFYMLDALQLLEDNLQYDMITTLEDTVYYRSLKVMKRLFTKQYQTLFYAFRKEQLEKALAKKEHFFLLSEVNLGISIYYLPYHQKKSGKVLFEKM